MKPEKAGIDELVGRGLGEFVLRERIGAGGFGVVYRAEQPALAREAVVKVLATGDSEREMRVQRFLREARLASQLDHPFAAHIYAFGAEPDGTLWIAMEYVRGTPLHRWLRKHGPFPVRQLVPFLTALAEVVHTAHERGIIHRDIKPSNVMVLPRAGRLLPKLLDLGVAKLIAGFKEPREDAAPTRLAACSEPVTVRTRLEIPGRRPLGSTAGERTAIGSVDDAAEDDYHQTEELPTPRGTTTARYTQTSDAAIDEGALTDDGTVIGSPGYMAPELWLAASNAGPHSDIYALGVLAYEALTGRRPFAGTDPQSYRGAHLASLPPPCGTALLDPVFARVLAKAPADRYSGALEFAGQFRIATGIGDPSDRLPRLDGDVLEAFLLDAPAPLAEAVAILDGAQSAHEARDAMFALIDLTARFVGALALASRTQLPGHRAIAADEPAADWIRTLRRQGLTNGQWIELARELCKPAAADPDSHPSPGLVRWLFAAPGDPTEDLRELRDADILRARDPQVRDWLVRELPRLARLLRGMTFLVENAVVVARDGRAERWNGARGRWREKLDLPATPLPDDRPLLLSPGGHALLLLWPMLQIAEPTPGADPDLFVIDGPTRHGARLRSGSGFALDAPGFWDWLSAELMGGTTGETIREEADAAPYLGLCTFSVEHADRFLGRELEVTECANRLRTVPLLCVVGPSGAGKSSFVRAGLLPAVEASWRHVILRPGPTPLGALRASLAGLGDEPTIAVIDQFEELFTMCRDPEEQRGFADALVAFAPSSTHHNRVVLTVRDDFLMRTEGLFSPRRPLTPGLFLLGVPARPNLVRMITEPARSVGYMFDDASLPEEMAEAVEHRPGALPLLSFTALTLWQHRDTSFRRLTRRAYEATGGVVGALARHADVVLDAMTHDQQRLAREGLRHLVTSEGTRVVLDRSELLQLLGERGEPVIERLLDARLLTASEGERDVKIELIHEALIAAWPRLADWRREDAEGSRLRDQLRDAARQWDSRARAPGLLWRDEALHELTVWRNRHQPSLTEVEASFADAAIAEARRLRRARSSMIAATIAALVVAVAVLLWFSSTARRQRVRAERNLAMFHEEQGRQLLLASQSSPALLHLVEARRLGGTGEALELMTGLASRAFDPQLHSLMHPGKAWDVVWTADGARLITAAEDGDAGVAQVWSARSGRMLASVAHDKPVVKLAVTSNGKVAASGDLGGAIRIWSVDDGAVGSDLRMTGIIAALAFDAAGARVGIVDYGGTLAVWNRTTGRFEVRVVIAPGQGADSLAFSPDGRTVVVGGIDEHARLYSQNGRLLRTLSGHDGRVCWAEFDPAGRRIVTASWDRTARIWDADSGELLATLVGHGDRLTAAEFSPDGEQIVTASKDRTVRIWEAASGRPLATLGSHFAGVDVGRFDPSGNRVLSAGDDGVIRLWDAHTGIRIASMDGHGGPVVAAAFSSDGARLATASWDRTVRVWNAAANSLETVTTYDAELASVDIDQQGSLLAAVTVDGRAEISSVRAGRGVDPCQQSGTVAIAFTTAGSVLLASKDRALRLCDRATGITTWTRTDLDGDVTLLAVADRSPWFAVLVGEQIELRDVATGRRKARFAAGDTINAIAVSAAGSQIAAGSADGSIRIWNRSESRPVDIAGELGWVNAVAFSSDGRQLVAAYQQGVRVWNPVDGKLVSSLDGHARAVTAAGFDDAGSLVATGSQDGTAKVWDAGSGRLLVNLEGHQGRIGDVQLLRDRLITVDERTARSWSLPRNRRTLPELQAFARCRIPYALNQGSPVPHATNCADTPP